MWYRDLCKVKNIRHNGATFEKWRAKKNKYLYLPIMEDM